MAHIGKLVVCGVGLIGGSFALALRRAGAVERIVGIGRRREVLERACALGVIDEIAEGWADALDGADLVLLAAPVGQTDAILAAMAPHLRPGTVVTDAGSTKRDVVAALRSHLGGALADVVPAHPIAGAEKSGVEAAFAELYMGRKVVLTPLPESRPEAVQKVRDAWEACGANVVGMTPQEHDRVFAAVSHLPHLLSFALVRDLAVREDRDLFFSFAASGFRDFTRIAASDPVMWRDVFLANRDAVLETLQRFNEDLTALQQAIRRGDGAKLEDWFTRTRAIRRSIIEQGQDDAAPDFGRRH